MHLAHTQLSFLLATKAKKVAVFFKPFFRQQSHLPVRQFEQTVSFQDMLPEKDKRKYMFPDPDGYTNFKPVRRICNILFQKNISHKIGHTGTATDIQSKISLQLLFMIVKPFDQRIFRYTAGT